MHITIKGAKVHNLKNIDAEFTDGLTAVTGVSGSGKTSLVFDTLYSEARRRLLSVFSYNFQTENISPADVMSISGLCPITALKQNLVNRNPNSILATASGLHPFLRLLFSNFGTRSCHVCGSILSVLSRDEIVHEIMRLSQTFDIRIFAPVVMNVQGSHAALLGFLYNEFKKDVYVDGKIYGGEKIDYKKHHDIYIKLPGIGVKSTSGTIRSIIDEGMSLGVSSFLIEYGDAKRLLTVLQLCQKCGSPIEKIYPKYFHFPCPYCGKKGCERCVGTGLHPAAANVKWNGINLPDLLKLPVTGAFEFFSNMTYPKEAKRLQKEIFERLEMLYKVGLGYVTLDRPSPTLSRGESQRLRLAVALTSRLENIMHILDEPTIGLHPADVMNLIPGLKGLGGPVIFIEHDNLAVSKADNVIDLGPGAGEAGGKILFYGTPSGLWKENSASGRYFSASEASSIQSSRNAPDNFIGISEAFRHNLRNINVRIPLSRLTVITGVSGSGKSTLIEDVLVPSLERRKPSGCRKIEIPAAIGHLKPVYVNQNPIGMNSRSNPATYAGLSGIVMDIFSSLSGINKSIFSFNTGEGSCPECGGTGEIEVNMRYMPSVWITCFACEGKKFSREAASLKISLADREMSIVDFYELSIDEAACLLENSGTIARTKKSSALNILRSLHDTGLGYLKIGQPSPTLSGGEAQRMKLAKYLSRKNLAGNILILDEPTTGLHPANVRDLLVILNRLVDANATVIMIEHNIDVMLSADWIIDLGPGSGTDGGGLIYQGNVKRFLKTEGSLTASALNGWLKIKAEPSVKKKAGNDGQFIIIKNAHANNLKNINVKIPKSKLTVVTGISGSGKSSLVHDILENEAKHEFFESLSVYERYNTREKNEVMADEVKGLGITMSIGSRRKPRDAGLSMRSTVGTVSEIAYHLGVLFSFSGKRKCLKCGTDMSRRNLWVCQSCGETEPIGEPFHFLGFSYASACRNCHGVGSINVPNPGKFIIHPEKPLCSGAMYSPGFFPQGYLCKPYNGGYYIVTAFAEKYGFDPFTLPWNEMEKKVRDEFLFGDTLLKVTNESPTGRKHTYDYLFRGFYGTWLRNWDMFGTYTDIIECPECGGSKLKTEYREVTLGGKNIHAVNQMSLKSLKVFLGYINDDFQPGSIAKSSYDIVNLRLDFLIKSGLYYVSTGRLASTLSAGEAQRIKLAALLGSGLNSLTVLLDEPTRGMHPGEIGILTDALDQLTKNNNTVIVVEHDPQMIESADHIIDLGPGSGKNGGRLVYEGKPGGLLKSDTITGARLNEKPYAAVRKNEVFSKWFVLKGARENNLKVDEVGIPYGTLTGVCGVSGSGKSTLIVDTIGRILSPRKHTTSVSYEPLKPGAYSEIINKPDKTVMVDQVITGITNPSDYLGLTRVIERYFAGSDEANISGIDPGMFRKCCSACKGRGWIKIDLNFLPDAVNECPVCNGTGYPAETGNVVIRGLTLSGIFSLTLEEAFEFFNDNETLRKKIGIALKTGLGYLVLRQPSQKLSGGEVQRLKIARELSDKKNVHTFYILDEPTIGLHLHDVSKLIGVLRDLVDADNTVIVIEHHTNILSSCDHLIELGPGGGEDGGRIIYTGPPEGLAKARTPTSPYLKLPGGDLR